MSPVPVQMWQGVCESSLHSAPARACPPTHRSSCGSCPSPSGHSCEYATDHSRREAHRTAALADKRGMTQLPPSDTCHPRPPTSTPATHLCACAPCMILSYDPFTPSRQKFTRNEVCVNAAAYAKSVALKPSSAEATTGLATLSNTSACTNHVRRAAVASVGGARNRGLAPASLTC